MSYEGYEEFICELGHYQKTSFYDDPMYVCSKQNCSARMAWRHSVDQTNGYEPEDHRTFAAPTVSIGWEDVPMEDHYGNKYLLKDPRVAPAPGSAWEKVPTEEEIAAWTAEWNRKQAVFAQHEDKYRIFDGETLVWYGDTEEEFDYFFDEHKFMNLRGYYPRTSSNGD